MSWCGFGGDPDAFWRQTPRTLLLFFKGKMKAAEREARQMRWAVWHTAALPLMNRFPPAAKFIDPQTASPASSPAARTFLALRGLGGDPPPAWVLKKFGL